MTKIGLKQRFSIKSCFSWRSAPIRTLRPNHRPGPAGPVPARPDLAGQDRPGQPNLYKDIEKYRPSFRASGIAFSIVFGIMSSLYSGSIWLLSYI